jgi:glycosyltransferase involved in cell wall biosynthesis
MSEPLRVLQVFARMDRGGAETMIMNLYRNMNRSEVQFDFVVHTNDHCSFDDEIKELGGKIFRIPAYQGRNHLSYKKSWEAFFKTHPEYKIIHGHLRSTASIYLKIAKKYGLVTIAHSHSTSSGTGLPALIKNTLQYPIRYIGDFLFACSQAAGIWLFGEKACKRENFYLLNNAIDSNKFIVNETLRRDKREEIQIQDKFVIGHVGRFNYPKNHEFLIDIFKAIHDKESNSVLMLVGDGELRKKIENKVAVLGLTNSVIFTGLRHDIPELLQAMDVILFPSLYEGLPVTIIEAQAAGLPCVISDQITTEVQISDLITSISLKEPPERWAETVLSYLGQSYRKNTYSEIAKAGYDIKQTSKWLQNFYLENNKMKMNQLIN